MGVIKQEFIIPVIMWHKLFFLTKLPQLKMMKNIKDKNESPTNAGFFWGWYQCYGDKKDCNIDISADINTLFLAMIPF